MLLKAVKARNVFIISTLTHPNLFFYIYETFCTIYMRVYVGARVYIEFCVRHFLVEISGVLVHRLQMYLSQRNHSGMQMHRDLNAVYKYAL